MSKLVPFNHPCLRQKSTIVDNFPAKEIAQELLTQFDPVNAVGLAAPQLGINKRAFIIKTPSMLEAEIFINPRILATNQICDSMIEGCLSLPSTHVSVNRPTEINVEFQDLEGRLQVKQLRHLEARVFQHELDHLDGRLILDYAQPKEKDAIAKALNKRARKGLISFYKELNKEPGNLDI